MTDRPLDPVATLAAALSQGDRRALARAITLVESQRPDDQAHADALLCALHARTGEAVRVGISGAPGVGKSTFVDALGTWLTARGHKVAALAIDPSSARSGGSILGDKTRMHRLARDPNAFVRPSPGGGVLGGVALRTREAIALCEATGFDVVLVETIGVGQSEVAAAGMVDFLLLLAMPGAGDDLQGIKRGITELADAVFVNKADGDRRALAEQARGDLEQALALLRGHEAVPVLIGSALTDDGMAEVWAAVEARRARLGPAGLRQRRETQAQAWFEEAVSRLLVERFLADPANAARWQDLRARAELGEASPPSLARRLLDA